MAKENPRETKEITVSEDEFRKWDVFYIERKTVIEQDVFNATIPPLSEIPRVKGRIRVTFAYGRENWGSLLDIKEGDVVIVKRQGLTDKRLECLKIDGSEIEFQDLWWVVAAKEGALATL